MLGNQGKLVNTLINMGLSENESDVYLTALSLGPCKVSDIARNSGIKRTTVYSVMEALKKIGLIVIEQRG